VKVLNKGLLGMKRMGWRDQVREDTRNRREGIGTDTKEVFVGRC
jgi:hypothetical protein